jgi:hypothetical protein
LFPWFSGSFAKQYAGIYSLVEIKDARARIRKNGELSFSSALAPSLVSLRSPGLAKDRNEDEHVNG